MKVLLIDDEAPARRLLREYLGAYPQLEIVAEATNGIEAIRLIGEHAPDLLFLDVQMPGLTGLEVLQNLPQLPKVIFATAYDAYALQAFELSAVDYLLKPFTRERLAKAVTKVLQTPAANLDGVQALTERLLSADRGRQYAPKILVSSGSKIAALDPADVIRLEAEGDYAKIVTAEKSYLSSSCLGDLAERLDPGVFVRVHRSHVINLGQLAEVSKDGTTFYLAMANGDRVRVSRGYADVVKSWVV